MNQSSEDGHVLVIDSARCVDFHVCDFGLFDDYGESKNFYGSHAVAEESLSES